MSEQSKRVYRLPPCPAYDVESMESWLEDMAKKGLHLDESDPFFAGTAAFVRDTPRNTRYRMDVRRRGKGLLDDNASPDEEQIALSRRLGWYYLGTRGNFSYYRTDDGEAPELNTDGAVQAYSIHRLEKQVRGTLGIDVYYGLIHPLLFFHDPLRASIRLGSWVLLLWALIFALLIAATVRQAVHLHRLRKRLERGDGLVHSGAWKKKAVWHHAMRGCIAAVVILLGVSLVVLANRDNSIRTENRSPLASYGEEIPFASLEDMFPEGFFVRSGEYSPLTNSFARWSDALAPECVDWNEEGTVTLPDGETFQIHIYVEYYRTCSPHLARMLAVECSHSSRYSVLGVLARALAGKTEDRLELPPLDADYACAYRDHFPYIILQKGDTVVCATYFTFGNENAPVFSYTDAARALAEKMR